MSDEPLTGSNGGFVLCAGRCGSTLVSRVLALHPDVLSLSEFFASLAPDAFPAGPISGDKFWSMLAARTGFVNQLLRVSAEPPEILYPVDDDEHRFDRAGGVPCIATVTLPTLSSDPDALYDRLAETVPGFGEQVAIQHYLELFSLLGGWLGKSCWVERSGPSGFFAEQIVTGFPDARYVHLTRDQDAAALSMSRHSGFRLIALWLEFLNRLGIDILSGEPPAEKIPPDLENLVPHRFSKETLENWDPGIELFQQMVSFQTDWIGAALKPLPPEQVLVLSYEDLVDQPVAEFGRLAEFFGLDDTAGWSRQAAALVRR